LPLPAQHRTSLTSFLTRPYTTTPQSQKQSQTNPISTPGAKKLTNQAQIRYHVFGTKGYDTASGAAKRASNKLPVLPKERPTTWAAGDCRAQR